MCVDLWIPMGILGWDGDEHPFAGRFRKNGAIYWFRPRNVMKNVGFFWGFKHGLTLCFLPGFFSEASAGFSLAEVCGWFDVADQLSAWDLFYDCAATGSKKRCRPLKMLKPSRCPKKWPENWLPRGCMDWIFLTKVASPQLYQLLLPLNSLYSWFLLKFVPKYTNYATVFFVASWPRGEFCRGPNMQIPHPTASIGGEMDRTSSNKKNMSKNHHRYS